VTAQVPAAVPPTDVACSQGSERKRKVEELFGDITDIELEDGDSLEIFCK
jgi:hypothetical protein